MFWLLTVCLFLLASMFVVVPLWLRITAASFESEELRKLANISLFHERNNELEEELAAGNIDQDQHNRLLFELQRSLLIDVGTNKLEPESDLHEAGLSTGSISRQKEKSRDVKSTKSKTHKIREFHYSSDGSHFDTTGRLWSVQSVGVHRRRRAYGAFSKNSGKWK